MKTKGQDLQVVALAVLFGLVTVLTLVGFFAAHRWMPPAASAHAFGMDRLIRYLLITTGTVFVIGHVVLIGFIWNYGRGRVAGSPETTRRAERLWSIIPVIGMALIAEGGVLVMGLPVWEQIYGETPEDALVVEVTARQFEWFARYPGPDDTFGRVVPELVTPQSPLGLDLTDPSSADDIILRNRVQLEEGRTAHVLLRSQDVLHAFWVPAFRVKQDVVPGIVGHTQFVPVEPGDFELGCAEVCGLAHYRMRGIVTVVSESDFETWLSEQTPGLR